MREGIYKRAGRQASWGDSTNTRAVASTAGCAGRGHGAHSAGLVPPAPGRSSRPTCGRSGISQRSRWTHAVRWRASARHGGPARKRVMAPGGRDWDGQAGGRTARDCCHVIYSIMDLYNYKPLHRHLRCHDRGRRNPDACAVVCTMYARLSGWKFLVYPRQKREFAYRLSDRTYPCRLGEKAAAGRRRRGPESPAATVKVTAMLR